MIKLVASDLDGTIIDSMAIWDTIGEDYLRSLGIEPRENLAEVLNLIRSTGVKCGAVINPDTPVEKIKDCIPLCDMVLVMTVEPGFGGQKFMEDMITYQEWLNHNYLLNRPNNVSTPYQIGDILKINAMPFGKDLYVVYGGEQEKGERERGNLEKHDSFYHWCIYESEDRNGLWIDDVSDAMFTDYIFFRNSPLINCERVDFCPDDKIMKVSKMLKDNPELWYELVSYMDTIRNGETNLDKWLFGED